MKETTVVYHIGHYGFFEKSLLHHFTYTKHANALFLIDELFFSDCTKKFIHGLKNTNLPFNIEIYNDKKFINEDEKKCRENVIAFFDSILKNYMVDANNCLFYSGFDTYSSFTAYLNLKHIHYSIFDGGYNAVSQNRYDCNIGQISLGYDKLLRSTDCLSIDAKYVDEVIWNCNEWDAKGKKSITLDYTSLASKLSEDRKKQLLKIFKMPIIQPGDYFLSILSSGWVVGNYKLKKETFFDAYKLIADYSSIEKNKLIVKLHPNFDIGEEIHEFFEDTIIINGFAPISLLKCYHNVNIISAISTGSTGGLGYSTASFPIELINEQFKLHLISAGISIAERNNVSLHFKNNYEERIYDNLPHTNSTTKSIDAGIYECEKDATMRGIILFDQLKNLIDHKNEHNECEAIIIVKNNIIVSMGFVLITDETLHAIEKITNLENYGGQALLQPFKDTDKLLKWLIILYRNSRLSDKIKKIFFDNSLEISHHYRFGIKLHKDLNAALEWAKIGLELGRGGSCNSIFDVCWAIDTSESYNMMIDAISKTAVRGDSTSIAQLGIAYFKGKGVRKDLGIAASLLRQARKQGLEWANWNLFDVLWEIGTQESYTEMINIALPLAEKGNAQLQVRIGRAYKEGRGVEKDLTKAAEWLEKAADQGLEWANNELAQVEGMINRAD